VNALVETAAGVYTIDVERDAIADFAAGASLDPPPPPPTDLPRVVAVAAAGSTVVVAVSAKPPLLVSHDAGATWRESGRGLPRGDAVAVSEANPDLVVFAAGSRLWISRDGGRFWHALAAELPEDVVQMDWM